MKLPADIIPLNKWTAYLAPLPPSSPKKHTVILVYRNGQNIKYFYITSQVAKAEIRYRDDMSALVKIQKDEWPQVLSESISCIQCGKNHLYCIAEEEFKEYYANNNISYIGEIPLVLQQRIEAAICASLTYNIVEQAQLTKDK